MLSLGMVLIGSDLIDGTDCQPTLEFRGGTAVLFTASGEID
jgi:hypothetical protein